jgi:hypothetical protein
MLIPKTNNELNALGWKPPDVIWVTGDTYVGSPFIGVAVFGGDGQRPVRLVSFEVIKIQNLRGHKQCEFVCHRNGRKIKDFREHGKRLARKRGLRVNFFTT